MINGFWEETHSLTEREKSAVGLLAEKLSRHVTSSQAITNDRLRSYMTWMYGEDFNFDPARMRKIINYIRTYSIVPRLIGSKRGYYVEPDDEKLATYIEGLRKRAEAINGIADCIERTT